MKRLSAALAVVLVALVGGCTPQNTPATTTTTALPVQQLREVWIALPVLLGPGIDGTYYPAGATLQFFDVAVQNGFPGATACIEVVEWTSPAEYVPVPGTRACGQPPRGGPVYLDTVPFEIPESNKQYSVVVPPDRGQVTSMGPAVIRWP
jgi:hypothetical protein